MKFNEKVWGLLKRIPKGKVSTYKIIARSLGSKGYRAVGSACNRNHCLIKVPCHRVVNSNGNVGNYSKGVKRKISLLEREGIEIERNRIMNFEKVLYRF